MQQPQTTYTVNKHVATITLARPEKRNALGPLMVQELTNHFKRADDDDAVKLILLKGEGPAFCAGADLAYLQQLQQNTFEDNLADSQNLMHLFETIYGLYKVVIAQVHGPAIAGGCGLASVCDLVLASDEALFGYSEVRIGFVPAIVAGFLVRKIGESKAKQMLLTGDNFSAQKAYEMGLVNELHPAAELNAATEKLLDRMVRKNSRQSMAATKQLLHKVQEMSMERTLDIAAQTNAKARATPDCQQGIAAFLNKQKLDWTES